MVESVTVLANLRALNNFLHFHRHSFHILPQSLVFEGMSRTNEAG